MKRNILCSALAIALFPSFSALAASSASTADPVELDERVVNLDALIVTGIAPSMAMTFVTDPKLPRQPVPASDGADYLKTIAGFSVLRSGGTNGDPVLRGMFGSRLNLLTNDGAMSGACPSRMDNAMSYISPETYDRLTVVKGPQTVLWGGGASAGTVRFEREIPYFDEAGVRINASLLGGSNGRNDQVLDTVAGNPFGYARFTANRSEADDYRDGDGKRVPSAWDKWNADMAFGWTPDADTVLEASVGTGDAQARYAGRGMDGSQFERTSYGLRFEKKDFEGLLNELKANVYYNDVDHVMDNYTLRDPDPMGSMPMPMASNVGHRTTGGRVAATWGTEGWEITAGVDQRSSRHSQRSAMGRGNYRNVAWTTDAEFDNLGVFAESHWHAGRNHVITGLRMDRAEVKDLRVRTGGMMPMPNPTAGMVRRETLPGGFLRFEQDLQTQPIRWYAGLGRTQRMPDYWELFSPGSGPVGSVNAFAAIQPETTTQFDLGLQYRGKRVDAWASVYAGRMQDYILFDYLGGGMMGLTTRAHNLDADIRGGEAGIEYRPADFWKLGGTLAYAWGEVRDTGKALPQMPPLEARISASYDNQKWSLGTLLRVVSSQDRVSPNQGNVVGRDLGRSSGFAVFSLNAGYRFSERLQGVAGIDNLFDRTYSEHLNLGGNSAFGYPSDPVRIHEPGRTFWAKLNYKY